MEAMDIRDDIPMTSVVSCTWCTGSFVPSAMADWVLSGDGGRTAVGIELGSGDGRTVRTDDNDGELWAIWERITDVL